MQQLGRRAQQLRDQGKPLQGRQLTQLQADWVKLRQPRAMAEAVAELDRSFHQTMDSLNARLQRESRERSEKLAELQGLVERMEADLDQEKYGEAVDLHRNISQQLKELGELPAADRARIERHLRAAAPLVMEFKDWRRWGTDQAREHLIETAQRLENDESMDPEQRAREIRALRQEWRKLAQMDPGHQRKQWKTFDSKVTAAYEPSRQHFEEQARQRAEHLQQREAICERLEALAKDTDWMAAELDWKALYAQITEERKQWKRCGTVGHKDWKAVNTRFNAAMEGLDAHLQVERERNLRERQRLVSTAEALLEREDLEEAVAAAKALQADWQITIPSRPREEQKLWKQFRTPLDQLFQRLKTERNSQRSETDQRIRDKESLCEQLEALAASEDAAFQEAVRELGSLRESFAAIRDLPRPVYRKLEDRFQAAERQVEQRQQQLQWQRRLQRLDELAEQAAARQAELEAGSSVVADDQLDERRRSGELLCLQMESLLDVPTPADYQQARMAWQVSRMSEAMRGRQAADERREQALELLAQWYQLGALPAAAREAQQARIQAVRQAIAK
ncbi:MAG: DUF349 domain-containing protein [Thiolinea sp.]